MQLASIRDSKKILPQRRNGAASFVAPLRRRVRKLLLFMLDTAPQHHTTTASAADPRNGTIDTGSVAAVSAIEKIVIVNGSIPVIVINAARIIVSV